MELVVEIYRITEDFPKNELYSLTSQLKRCAVSVPSNIAEGSRRGSRKDYKNFLRIAYGSGAELETQLEIAKRLSFITLQTFDKLDSSIQEIQRMLNGLINKL